MTGARLLRPEDVDRWMEMRARLWPEATPEELSPDAAEVFRGRLGVVVWEEGERLVGFAEVSMRSAVDGASSSPVGYLEGWWVDEDQRRRGIGAALVTAAEQWAVERGAREMGSDSVVGNDVGEAAHRAVGFSAIDTVTQWLKAIATPAPAEGGGEVSLRPIDRDNVRTVAELTVSPHQTGFVAPNAVSIAQASVTDESWLRAVYAGETPVGLVLLFQGTEEPTYYLWRFMIDARYQGRGYGRRAMGLLVDHVRTLPGAVRLLLSYVPLPGGPGDFYRALGFVETGKVEDGEVEAALDLAP